MKPTEKAALIASAGGLVAGFGLAWLLEGASVWFYAGVGFAVAAGLYHQSVKSMAAARIVDGDFPSADKS